MSKRSFKAENDLEIAKYDVRNSNALELSSHIIDRCIRTLQSWFSFSPRILKLLRAHVCKILKRHRLKKSLSPKTTWKNIFPHRSWLRQQHSQECYRFIPAYILSKSLPRFLDHITCTLLTWTPLSLDRSAASWIYVRTDEVDFKLWYYWSRTFLWIDEQYDPLILM